MIINQVLRNREQEPVVKEMIPILILVLLSLLFVWYNPHSLYSNLYSIYLIILSKITLSHYLILRMVKSHLPCHTTTALNTSNNTLSLRIIILRITLIYYTNIIIIYSWILSYPIMSNIIFNSVESW